MQKKMGNERKSEVGRGTVGVENGTLHMPLTQTGSVWTKPNVADIGTNGRVGGTPISVTIIGDDDDDDGCCWPWPASSAFRTLWALMLPLKETAERGLGPQGVAAEKVCKGEKPMPLLETVLVLPRFLLANADAVLAPDWRL